MRGIAKSLQVNVIIPANNTSAEIKFPEQSDLRYARILGLETYTATDYAQATPGNTAIITDAQIKLINVTFETNDPDDWQEQLDAAGNPIMQNGGYMLKPDNPSNTGKFRTTSQNIKWQPLVDFHRVQNTATAPFVRELLEYNNIFITWEKSFITMPTPISPIADLAVVFQVYYTYRSITGRLISRT